MRGADVSRDDRELSLCSYPCSPSSRTFSCLRTLVLLTALARLLPNSSHSSECGDVHTSPPYSTSPIPLTKASCWSLPSGLVSTSASMTCVPMKSVRMALAASCSRM